MNEIWVSKCHMNCDCVNSYPVKENIEIRKGENFWIVHNKALDEERKAGLISTPYTELK